MKALILTEEMAQRIYDYIYNSKTIREPKGAILALLTPTELPKDAEEVAKLAVDTIDRLMLALGEETETSRGIMQPPQVQRDKATPYLTSLIAAYARQVPRAMLDEIWAQSKLHGTGATISEIVDKYHYTVKE